MMAALTLLVAACSSDDGSEGPTTTLGSASTTAGGVSPTVAAPDTTTATTTVPVTTSTTEAAFEPPATIVLDDPSLALEPPDVSYRAHLSFEMRAEMADGSVQEGLLEGDGGKLTDPAEMHSFVVAVEGLVDVPGCFDIAAATPQWVSAYDTFYGGLSGDEGGDLMGEAALLEAGIMTNGVFVDRYEITLDNVDGDSEDEYASFDEAYIDIARDGGHVVRLYLNGTGTNNSFTVDQSEPRAIVYQLNFSEFGELTEFTVPDDC